MEETSGVTIILLFDREILLSIKLSLKGEQHISDKIIILLRRSSEF